MYAVLVVSIPYTAYGFEAAFARFSFSVETCDSIELAKERVQGKAYDLVIVDHTSTMSGTEFLVWLRDSNHLMPVILHQAGVSQTATEVLNLARFCTERDALVLAGADLESPRIFVQTIERLFPGSRLTAM